MNNIDKEKYIEVLLALAGFGNINTERDSEGEKPCQRFCQSNEQSPENTAV